MFNIIEMIRRRSREEHLQQAKECWTSSRIWIQEHGERSAVIALVGGIVFVLFFQVVVSLFFLAIVVAGIVWFTALPGTAAVRPMPGRTDDSGKKVFDVTPPPNEQ